MEVGDSLCSIKTVLSTNAAFQKLKYVNSQKIKKQ